MSTDAINTQQSLQRVEIGQFGVHLMLDGYDGSATKLADQSLIADLLNALPCRLGMHKIAEPVVVAAGLQNRKDHGGLSGFVLTAESHICVHTFPIRGYVSADVYTCQNRLDVGTIVSWFETGFELQTVERHKINRGLSSPSRNIYSSPARSPQSGDIRLKAGHGC